MNSSSEFPDDKYFRIINVVIKLHVGNILRRAFSETVLETIFAHSLPFSDREGKTEKRLQD